MSPRLDLETQLQALGESGCALVPTGCEDGQLRAFERVLDAAPDDAWRIAPSGERFAIRDAHLYVPKLRECIANSPLPQIAKALLGTRAATVGATYFDKLPGANWAVPAHQDLFVPVTGKTSGPGFWGKSKKQGTTYVGLPDELLHQMVALRLHLDDCSVTDGALEVVPGSHSKRIESDRLERFTADRFAPQLASRGDILCMRPLLVHRSASANVATRRRVLHVLFAGAPLPDGTLWT